MAPEEKIPSDQLDPIINYLHAGITSAGEVWRTTGGVETGTGSYFPFPTAFHDGPARFSYSHAAFTLASPGPIQHFFGPI